MKADTPNDLKKQMGPLSETQTEAIYYLQQCCEELLKAEAITEDELRTMENMERSMQNLRLSYTHKIINLLRKGETV